MHKTCYERNEIYWEDCLSGMRGMPDASVDMILCDLPYGSTECKWDRMLPFPELWEQYRRIIVNDGAIVLFGNFPFSAKLCLSAPDLFRYPLVWKRSRVTRHAQANYRPLSEHEDILVFSKAKCSDNARIRAKYNPQGVKTLESARISTYAAHSLRPGRAPKTRITRRSGFPRSILSFASDSRPIHPTQKPVALCEYLVRTYTNARETVLDNCIGSGTTAIACMNAGRDFIGFETDRSYYEAARERIEACREQRPAPIYAVLTTNPY